MRQFGSSGFRLWNLSVPAKTLYTAFCLLTFLGVVSSMLYYQALVGPTPGLKGVRRYYAGETEPRESPSRVDGPPSSAGPSIELPPETAAEESQPLVVAVSYRKLLEVTHFHLFTMPVVLLIVGHLFLATSLGERTKLVWMALGGGSVCLHIAAPWLVRYVSPALAWLYAVSGAALFASMSVLTLYPGVVMWRAPGRRREASSDADR